jgi:hypothetical protein
VTGVQVSLLKSPYAGWEAVAHRREQRTLSERSELCEQASLSVMVEVTTRHDLGPRCGDDGRYPKPVQVLQAVSCRPGCASWFSPGAWRFRRLFAGIDDEGPRPWVPRRCARAQPAQPLFRPGSPSLAISDSGIGDNSRRISRSVGATTTRSPGRRDPDTLGESSRSAFPCTGTAKEIGVPEALR